MPLEARAYPRPLPNPEWLGKLTEEILEPDLPIVDPHHHLWDHPGSRYLLDELLADVGSGHNIVATVFIQCGSGYRTSGPEEMCPIGESEFVRAIAEEGDRRGGKTKICAGIVSFADLRLPNVDAVLEGQIAASGEMANAWRPYVDACIENFGADRCMFESNFPVDKGACSYPVLFNAFKRLANGASASEKADLFADTTSRFYRLGK
jgi:predicted TIM-barrel fold metal-dependent hydrolase